MNSLADDLHREFVAEYVRGTHPNADRLVRGLYLIAEERGFRLRNGNPDVDRAFKDVREEAYSLGAKQTMFDT